MYGKSFANIPFPHIYRGRMCSCVPYDVDTIHIIKYFIVPKTQYLKAISLKPHNPVAHFWYGASCLSSLGRLDEALAARPGAAALRARSSILAMSEALTQHAAYFGAGPPG